ncbi:Fe(3+) ABC transporter substrate-binding protein [Azospirillum sp. RWY-5-1]|uniref:Fe(3+) ABC transporter substrate-binding protein n=1 Tax=Azospirillum oleiclasticum TaxID=2735135 RepID=A0ABX2TH17_9PROT|nr:Fe(3+) ABC transporter substrate-binding protein [Azospirillum oleiclasticum]NYZ14690.1 Fe(3+) ABC transporter substrate-binding protein [Azospirillum oleiclasticum]NYZ22324.1 Fe(3+) ABC transporter substrate-binding protein [Azospirillum oleiclasticum]
MDFRTRSLFAAVLGAAILAAGTASAAEVNLYSARHYDTDKALYETFTKQTGIKVNLIEGKEEELIERMRNEGGNSPADLLITVDAGRLWRAQDAGVLQPTKSAILEKAIPAHLREPEGYWFGISKRARVLIYNKAAVKPSELGSYEDLADPKWKGRVLIRSSTNVYNQSLTGSILAALGEEKTEAWAKGLVANMARKPQGGDSDQIKAVAAGEGDVAISNTYYFGRIAGSSKPEDKAIAEKLGVFFPGQQGRGTHVNVSGIGVAKNAPNRENAVKFIEYLVTPEAQKMFAESNYEYPVVAGVAVHPVVAAWGPFKEDELNAAVYGKNNAEALKVMDRAGWK